MLHISENRGLTQSSLCVVLGNTDLVRKSFFLKKKSFVNKEREKGLVRAEAIIPETELKVSFLIHFILEERSRSHALIKNGGTM